VSEEQQTPPPQQARPSASLLEIEEYLFITTLLGDKAPEEQVNKWRDVLWSHRFFVFSWLLMNGATIPAHLVDDRTHPRTGEQSVDEVKIPDEYIRKTRNTRISEG